MGYMHIDNLYKDITIMNFKECYALEKIHGTSAHISWKDNKILFMSGGMEHKTFIQISDLQFLENLLLENFKDIDVVVFGEAYGGKMQGMSQTYGTEPKFVVFDIKIRDIWLNVPNAHDVANKLNLEFVDYEKVSTDIESLNRERDKPSTQAKRNGITEDKLREGVVLRPLEEMIKSNGKRVIVKHKRDEFMETNTKREVDPAKLKVLEEARAIAEEWVTPMRLEHVLDKLGNPTDIKETGKVIKAMIEDVLREAKGEIIESSSAKQAIGKYSAKLFKNKISKI